MIKPLNLVKLGNLLKLLRSNLIIKYALKAEKIESYTEGSLNRGYILIGSSFHTRDLADPIPENRELNFYVG